ncbi:MAG: hypothetical protein VYB96_10085, partial [Pseudomonadota bacterium]|nr:hypothetical protein [Pseudomonadota bacterium]
GDPQPVSAPGASSPWAVSADTPATPHGASITAASAIPVYEYRNVPVAIPQEILDPDKVAASPIRKTGLAGSNAFSVSVKVGSVRRRARGT